jgi:antitoxin FitA
MKLIQIRNVPDSVHRRIKARAALEGRSMSDFLLDEVRRIAERPSLEELRRRLSELEPVDPGEDAAEAVRAERDNR